MPQFLDQLLPSLSSLTVWIYWIVALLAALEATVLVGIVVPGMLAVFAGGMLVQGGSLEFGALLWFAAAGAALGGEASFHLGQGAVRSARRWSTLTGSPHARRAEALLRRYGGFAIVLGRFRGPLSGFVPTAAGMDGMSTGRFRLWNVLGAVAYALLLPGLGYLAGQAIAAFGATAPRAVAFGLASLAMLGILWILVRRVRKAIPPLLKIARAARASLLDRQAVRSLTRRYPGLSRFLAARFGTERFLGLTATVLGVLFLYVAAVWADSVYDFLGDASVTSADTRVANLLYGMRDPQLVSILGWITDAGGRHGVLPMLAGVTVALLVLRRYDLLGGLGIAAIGNQLTVTLLKSLFARPRSVLGYFVETSGSFPSGHAAASVAVWAMLFYLAWRLRLLSASAAAVWAVTVVFLVGLSRIYLVEHYLSDVLNGYLVGGLWLILGMAFCEWRRGTRAVRSAPSVARRWVARSSVALAGGAVIWLATVTATPLNETLRPDLPVVAQPGSILTSAALPRTTETLTGDPRQEVDLIVNASDAAELTAALEGIGWDFAPHPGVGLLAIAIFDGWTGRALPDPLVIPTFWDDRPSALGFAQPAAGGMRLHLRFWDSRFRTEDGSTVFVGTLTQEDPLDWILDEEAGPWSPDVAGPLDRLAADLRAAGIGVDILR